MPNSKPRPESDNNTSLPWKNSLLTKEVDDQHQNPLNHFSKIIRDSDTFSILFEEIQNCREAGKVLEFYDRSDRQKKSLEAFVVVQDARGTNWICPVLPNGDRIDQNVYPLDLTTDVAEDAFRDAHAEAFGTLQMSVEDYISACSRGFENASRLFLGEEAIKLSPNHRPVAAFYVFPKNSQK